MKNKIILVIVLLAVLFVGAYCAFDIYQKYNKSGEVRGFINGIFIQEEEDSLEEIEETKFLFEYTLNEFYPYKVEDEFIEYRMDFEFPAIDFDNSKDYVVSVNDNNIFTNVYSYSIESGFNLKFTDFNNQIHYATCIFEFGFLPNKTNMSLKLNNPDITEDIAYFNKYIEVFGLNIKIKEMTYSSDSPELLPIVSSDENYITIENNTDFNLELVSVNSVTSRNLESSYYYLYSPEQKLDYIGSDNKLRYKAIEENFTKRIIEPGNSLVLYRSELLGSWLIFDFIIDTNTSYSLFDSITNFLYHNSSNDLIEIPGFNCNDSIQIPNFNCYANTDKYDTSSNNIFFVYSNADYIVNLNDVNHLLDDNDLNPKFVLG